MLVHIGTNTSVYAVSSKMINSLSKVRFVELNLILYEHNFFNSNQLNDQFVLNSLLSLMRNNNYRRFISISVYSKQHYATTRNAGD